MASYLPQGLTFEFSAGQLLPVRWNIAAHIVLAALVKGESIIAEKERGRYEAKQEPETTITKVCIKLRELMVKGENNVKNG